MKNICKKLIIMFVMVLGIVGVGIASNVYVANAAAVGQQLKQPEDGWQRFDDNEKCILYPEGGKYYSGKDYAKNYYNGTVHYCDGKLKTKIYFYGDKFRYIGYSSPTHKYNVSTYIDGELKQTTSLCTQTVIDRRLICSEEELDYTFHEVEIIDENKISYNIDAIDINKDGYLFTFALETNQLKLKDLESENLNLIINSTTSDAVEVKENVKWISSDESVATVDQDGKVTAIKEGTCIITALIEGTDIKDTCEVTVTKEDVPVDPEEPTGDGSLYIEMVDGNIKQAQNLDVADFIKWFKDRDLDDTESPIYKIKNAKGNTEYLVHDKIVAFEVR